MKKMKMKKKKRKKMKKKIHYLEIMKQKKKIQIVHLEMTII